MTSPQLFVEGKPVRLGSRIGKGGEGEVFALADDDARAIKIYTAHDGPQREAKIEAIVRLKLAQQSSLVAFPIAIARDQAGKFTGFTMHRVREHKPIFELYGPGARKQNFQEADYRFLVRAALNTARAIAAVHKTGSVIGDINHSGILISKNATAALIDADSFQITDGCKSYLCRVGVPEYTPPELQGMSLGNVTRTVNHDVFGLAITIFLLIAMGRHPFVGSYAEGEMPIQKAISEFRFAYSRERSVGMTPPPGACTLDDFPGPMATAFEEAFGPSQRDHRPTSLKWVSLLEELERSLQKCPANSLHYYASAAKNCPWCRMEKRLGMVLFLPANFTIPGTGTGDFNLQQLWAQIEAIRIPTRAELTPAFPTAAHAPSPEAVAAKQKSEGRIWLAALGVLIAILIAAAGPALWFVAVGVAIWGFVLARKKNDVSPIFQERFFSTESEWNEALDRWERRCGIEKIENLKATLTDAKRTYEGLAGERAEHIRVYQTNRQSFQLAQFLDKFRIRDYKISGIGPTKLATLASYGVETAANVTQEKVLAVPGFGPINSKPLFQWQQERARTFVYNLQPNAADQFEFNKIMASIEQRAQTLRQTLTSQARELDLAVRVCRHMIASPDPQLKELHERRSQIEADLGYLNIPLPSRALRTPSVARQRTYRPAPNPTPVQTSGKRPAASTPACPLCQRQMVQRTARRGRHSGRPFWGCSGYPRCRGTRPI